MKWMQQLTRYFVAWGRYILIVVGIFFILFAFFIFGYSWYDPVWKFFAGTEEKAIAFFLTIAEYYLIAVTFAIVGRSLLFMAGFGVARQMDISELKKHLFAMIVAISGVTFINMLVRPATPLGINILWIGLSIAAVAMALAGYIHITCNDKEAVGKRQAKE